MAAVLIRIGLRYGAGYLIARGLLSDDAGNTLATDPDVQLAIGAALGAAAEGWYFIARKLGWAK
ncbi:hypothetical protein [Mesorhizobium sp. Pch-S]|uniref:Pam3-gp28 family putative phage holin n=1 Tax=Mesorhizobium sp. Pch-S TaxID=2082387 RepID=UPI0010121257|nr:hypothetical protein [Mesorhizobium sp. Pch-S]QAZ46751.1 hypothetical protein C1M53_31350 [Mesorhizobium sp. Pch-S]